jgi:predicted helicase
VDNITDDIVTLYEQAQIRPGADPADRETWRVAKMKWKTKGEHTAIVYNPKVTITGIPEEAERYQLGSRRALGWIIDRYQYDDPTYVVALIKRVTTVAVETTRIVDNLAPA